MTQHLIESTLFAAIVWLLTLALRRNHARARHRLWIVASVKFLLPFSLLVALGSHVIRHDSSLVAPPQMQFIMADVSPAVPYAAIQAPSPRQDWLPLALWLLWIGVGTGILIRWYVRWRAAFVKLSDSVPWNGLGLPVVVRRSASVIEPGIFGIFRPVLMVPAGIEEHLSDDQLHAVFAHEMCHVRHHDNLAAAVHMLVEAAFWFHPLVWWIGARLVDERELACDEEVLQNGSDRAVYAASILRICEFCVELPVPCVSSIAGADLKWRIRHIMTGSVRRQLEPSKKLLLAALGIAALAIPLTIGLTHPAKLRAQTAVPVRFDVASVKVSEKQFLVFEPQRSGGRITWLTDLSHIVCYAYNLPAWRVTGFEPDPLHIYEVDATTDPKASEEQVRLMFQALLADRFHLTAHRVTKDSDGYALTVAKTPKLVVAKEDVPPLPEWARQLAGPADLEGKVVAAIQTAGVGVILGRRATMQQFCDSLQRVLHVAVLDDSGLTSKYYFAFQFAQEQHPDDVNLPDLFTALRDLGLKLEKHKGPMESLVVDHIEKIPTEN